MLDRHATQNYGWRDAEPTCAHGYLEPVVLGWLRRLGARRILDLGFGNGSLCRTLKDAGFDVVGCDADQRGSNWRTPRVRWDSHHTPLWEGGHIKFWSRTTLTELLERGGFRVTGFTGAGRVPLPWKSMVLVAQRP